MAEVAYQRGSVTIDEHFVRFGSKSYALNKINSVDVKHTRRDSAGWLFMAIIGALIALAGLGKLQTDGAAALGYFVVAALFAVPAFFLFKSRTTHTYYLMFATSSGEAQATQTHDGDAIEELRRAIEAAIVARG